MPEPTLEKRCDEEERLEASRVREKDWQRWGTYLPERQWGTVREDYSGTGDCWNYFPYEMAQFRAYRWGEDGLLGWTDRECRLCFSISFWNGNDGVLKERLFGLSNPEGNHGEDVKELYYYLDATPTHSYAKALYKYPHAAFPYADLREQNKSRGTEEREYELRDTGVFDEDRYFDIGIEYAKADVDDILIRLTVSNRGPESATVTLLPTLTFRNDWSWTDPNEKSNQKPSMKKHGLGSIRTEHPTLGSFVLMPVSVDASKASFQGTIFTENDTNEARLDPAFSGQPPLYRKDAFDRYLIHGEEEAVNPEERGTKAAFIYSVSLQAGEETVLTLRLVRTESESAEPNFLDASSCIESRIREADEFYTKLMPPAGSLDEKNVSRQAYAGLLWSKQFYYYVGQDWSSDDRPSVDGPNDNGTNSGWKHLFCRDVLSVPDKWEYPWFAAWDLAFHMLPMATLDPEFAKAQLLLLLREWYLHPNGQMPAYEFSFGDVNPPVHPWAVWHVYRVTKNRDGVRDLDFLERAFQKLLLNFTWWVNRNDFSGRNLFGGGFLGLDNIGVFDRSSLPEGVQLDQADATAWMGLYCSCMLQMAIELAQTRPAYEDIASKFLEHYISVIKAINLNDGAGLWDEEEGFYFDRMTGKDGQGRILRVRSLVGIVPLFGICIMKKDQLDRLPQLSKRAIWFRDHRPELNTMVYEAETDEPDFKGAPSLTLVPKDRLLRILKRVLDESEFLSPFGIRSISKFHEKNPFEMDLEGKSYRVEYVHADGNSNMFGGNSNWRGPIWLPMNALFCLALDQYYLIYGDSVQVECPTGSGCMMTLQQVSGELNRRISSIFLADDKGCRPCHEQDEHYATDPHWKDLLLFNEYFSGDTGRGVGASHQTGWTALVAAGIRWRYSSSEERLQMM
jgi:hypothetical protein